MTSSLATNSQIMKLTLFVTILSIFTSSNLVNCMATVFQTINGENVMSQAMLSMHNVGDVITNLNQQPAVSLPDISLPTQTQNALRQVNSLVAPESSRYGKNSLLASDEEIVNKIASKSKTLHDIKNQYGLTSNNKYEVKNNAINKFDGKQNSRLSSTSDSVNGKQEKIVASLDNLVRSLDSKGLVEKQREDIINDFQSTVSQWYTKLSQTICKCEEKQVNKGVTEKCGELNDLASNFERHVVRFAALMTLKLNQGHTESNDDDDNENYELESEEEIQKPEVKSWFDDIKKKECLNIRRQADGFKQWKVTPQNGMITTVSKKRDLGNKGHETVTITSTSSGKRKKKSKAKLMAKSKSKSLRNWKVKYNRKYN